MSKLNTTLPVYVTRKTATGFIAAYSMNAWVALLALWLITMNVILWGIVGIIYAFKVVF